MKRIFMHVDVAIVNSIFFRSVGNTPTSAPHGASLKMRFFYINININIF